MTGDPTFTISLEGYEQALTMFDGRVVDTAARRALTRAIERGRTEARRAIHAKWNIKKTDINRAINSIKVSGNEISAIISAKGRPLSLSYFGAKEYAHFSTISRSGRKTRKTQNKSKKGVYVKIYRDGQLTHKPKGFVQTMHSGHIGVFERVGKSRYPIRERKVITIASMFSQSGAIEPTVEAIHKSWSSEFFRQLEMGEYGA